MLRWLGCCLRWLALSAAVTLLVLGVTAGAFVVLVLTTPALTKEFGPVVGLSLFCIGLPLTFVLALAAHEAGHVLGAACAGLSPRFAHVGPITFTRGRDGWNVGWDGQRSWLGGRAVCALPARGRWRWAVFLLAGPLANLVSGVTAAWLAGGELPALLRCWVGLFAAHSLYFGVVNLVPLREWGLDSDGLALVRLFAGGEPGAP